MPHFVLMTKLSTESLSRPEKREKRGREWLAKVKQTCPQVKFLAHYALLGRYDFLDIYEAPDIETAHMVSLISRSAGAESAESWQALPYEEHLALVDKIPS
jgi:uncharacterized protein with GYD domain